MSHPAWITKKILYKEKNGEKMFTMYFINLLWESRKRHDKTIHRMLRKVSAKDVKDSKGKTLLHIAVENGNYWLVKILLKMGCSVDAQDRDGKTPLMKAFTLERKCYKILKCLMNANPNIYLTDSKGQSTLGIAMKYSVGSRTSFLIRKWFLKKIQDTSDTNKILRFLRGEVSPLYHTIYLSKPNITNVMIKVCDVNFRGFRDETALHIAAKLMDSKNIELLLKHGAKKTIVNYNGKFPFACIYLKNLDEDLKIMRLLLPYDNILTSTDKKSLSIKTQLNYIFQASNAQILTFFLQQCKLDLKAQDRNERTPLHYLALNSNRGVMDLFKDAEFDVDVLDNYGRSAMIYATSRCNLNMMKFLLDKGADMNFAMTNRQKRCSDIHWCSTYCTVVFNSRTIFEKLSCLEFLVLNRAIFIPNGTDRDFYYDMEVFRLVVEHLVLLELLGTPITQEILNDIENIKELRNCYDVSRCKFEEMKSTIICGTISVFDLLMEERSADIVAQYARRRKHVVKLMKPLKAIELKIESNPYTELRYVERLNLQWCRRILEKRFFMAKLLICWREKIATILSESIEQFNPHHIILETIVNYLSEADLKKAFC